MELLAPASDLNTLIAALDAGADAVYVGLKKFSARARAKNLSIEELYKASNICKKQSKKLYVALNTLIFEDEIEELIEILLHLEAAKIDGVIIQDYGIYQLVKDFNLKLNLHASTQMGTKNHIQANFLKELGFKRVILERQLTFDEIRSIRKKTDIELEVFVHGAMCFALSGYCFFSKMLTKRSGNRGECAQPCRWFYYNNEKNAERPFFMKDLLGISLLFEFKKIGINALKIEGRLKGVEYVYNVVSLYRKAIDMLNEDFSIEKIECIEEELKKIAFSREYCKGFFIYPRNVYEIISKDSHSVGAFVGDVALVYEKSFFFKTYVDLSIGDGLRIVKKDDTSFKLPIKALYKGKSKVRKAKKGEFIGIPCNIKGVEKGDKIYLVHRRFSYKLSIKISDNIEPADTKDKLKKILKTYKMLYDKDEKNIKCYEIKFNPESLVKFEKETAFFIYPNMYESKIDMYDILDKRDDISSIFISHPAEAKIFKNNKKVYSSFFLYVTNKPAMNFLKKLGIEGFSKSIEIEKERFEILKNQSKTWFLWKNVPLWITRVPLKDNVYKTKDGVKIEVRGVFGFTLKGS